MIEAKRLPLCTTPRKDPPNPIAWVFILDDPSKSTTMSVLRSKQHLFSPSQTSHCLSICKLFSSVILHPMSPFNIINRLAATSCTPTRPTTRIHKASTPFPGAACPFGISSVLHTAASSINTSTSSSPKKTQDIQIIQEKSLLKFAEPHGSHREPIQADQSEEADQPQGSERAQAQPDREQIMFRNPVSSVICWPTPRLFALAHLLQLLEAQHLICTSSYASLSECFHLCMLLSAANAS